METLLEIAKAARKSIKRNKISKVENGTYDVIVEEPELRNRKDGQGSYIIIPLRISNGRYKDIVIPDLFSFSPYRLKKSIYNLEDMLEVAGIELSEECYSSVSDLHEALRNEFAAKEYEFRIRYYRDGSCIRIDFLSVNEPEYNEAERRSILKDMEVGLEEQDGNRFMSEYQDELNRQELMMHGEYTDHLREKRNIENDLDDLDDYEYMQDVYNAEGPDYDY